MSFSSLGSGSVRPPEPTPAVFKKANVTVADGSANIFVYEPKNLTTRIPVGGWPVVLFFGGDGTSNSNTRTTTSMPMTNSGDNLTYTHSPTPSLFRILTTSIVIKVNGTPVATGKLGGIISGSGIVSGSLTNFDTDNTGTNTSPIISVTFGSSQAGNSVEVDFLDSVMFFEGPPRWINLGDTLDDRCIFIAIQNMGNFVDYDLDYFDKAVEYAWNNYTINPLRISVTGISRGGRNIIDQTIGANTSVLKTRYQFWIDDANGTVYTSGGAGRTESGLASVVCGTASYGGTFTAANYTDIGIAIVHGTGDGTLTNTTFSLAANLASNNEPPYILNIPAAGHSKDVWDGKCFKRLYRIGPVTGSITTAPWDWLDFLLRYSKDQVERAILFTEQAERRRYRSEKDIIEYRHAKRQVDGLGSGSTKDDLLARLSTLKNVIDDGGSRWVFNPHSAGLGESAPYINMPAATDGSGVTNVADWDSFGSTVDLTLTTSPNGGLDTITSNRRSYSGGFSKVANESGLGLTTSPLGLYTFTGLPEGLYTIRVYHNVGVGNFSGDPRARVVINSITKSEYSGINTLIGYIEFTNITSVQLATVQVSWDTSTDSILTIIELYHHPKKPFRRLLNFGGVAAEPAASAGSSNLWDNARVYTDIDYPIVGNFSLRCKNTLGRYWGFISLSANKAGDEPMTGTNFYPADVIDTWWFVETRSADVILRGLTPGKKYKLIIVGCRAATAEVRRTEYTIGNTSIVKVSNRAGTVSQFLNESECAVFTNISPDSVGELLITTRNHISPGYGYLNAIEILELPSIGNIFTESSFSSVSDFPITSPANTITRDVNKLNMHGAPALWASYVQYDKVNTSHRFTCLEYWKQRVRVKTPNVINSTSYGIGIGVRSTNSFNAWSGYLRWSFDTGGPGALGSLYLYSQDTTSGQIQSVGAYTPVANTYYWIEVERLKHQTIFTLFSDNGTWLFSETLSTSLTTGYVSQHNTGKFTLQHFGGNGIEVTHWEVSSDSLKEVDYVVIGDSNTYGLYAGDNETRWVQQAMKAKDKTYVVHAGLGDRSADVIDRLPEIIALRPKNAILSIGRNDVANSVSIGTIQANIDTIISTLEAAGIVVKLAGVIASSVDVSAVQTHYNGKSNQKVNFYTLTKGAGTTLNATYNSGDNIHINVAGHNVCATEIQTIL